MKINLRPASISPLLCDFIFLFSNRVLKRSESLCQFYLVLLLCFISSLSLLVFLQILVSCMLLYIVGFSAIIKVLCWYSTIALSMRIILFNFEDSGKEYVSVLSDFLWSFCAYLCIFLILIFFISAHILFSHFSITCLHTYLMSVQHYILCGIPWHDLLYPSLCWQFYFFLFSFLSFIRIFFWLLSFASFKVLHFDFMTSQNTSATAVAVVGFFDISV